MDEFKDIITEEKEELSGEEKAVRAAELFTPRQEKVSEAKPWYKELYEWAQSIAFAVIFALLINQFLFALVQVEGDSMLPTLHNKERLVVTKLFYEPDHEDIVVVKSRELGKFIIKRIIAVPGDVLDIRPQTGQVLLNGEELSEPYILEKLHSGGHIHDYPITVPEGYVFVMGDNRNNSHDSRTLGLIRFEDVVGKASLRIMPFSRFGGLD